MRYLVFVREFWRSYFTIWRLKRGGTSQKLHFVACGLQVWESFVYASVYDSACRHDHLGRKFVFAVFPEFIEFAYCIPHEDTFASCNSANGGTGVLCFYITNEHGSALWGRGSCRQVDLLSCRGIGVRVVGWAEGWMSG
jgi:hypothetical protein